LTVFRFDKLRDIDITLGTNARPEFAIVPVENPSDEQRRLYGTYTGAEL
jgi:predicted metalloprotease with PDZ domain